MSKQQMIKVSIDTNVSKEKAWDLLFNRFGEVNVFNPLIQDSHHYKGTRGEVGCERKCEIEPGKWVHERISNAKGNEEFDIEILEGGLPMVDEMQAKVNLESLALNKTRVTFSISVSTKPVFMIYLMKGMMKAKFMDLLIGLKYNLETGGSVTDLNIKAIKRQYKSKASDQNLVLDQSLAAA